mgnify:CR=1 FL=1
MKRDVAKAKALLAEAGYPNGIDTERFQPLERNEGLAKTLLNTKATK